MENDENENTSLSERRISPRIQKLKTEKALRARSEKKKRKEEPPVKKTKTKTKKNMNVNVRKKLKVESVEKKVNMDVCEEQRMEESRNGVEKKESMIVCKEQQMEESVEKKENMNVCEELELRNGVEKKEEEPVKKIMIVYKRQKVEGLTNGGEKLEKKAEIVKQGEECGENEMTDGDRSAFALVTDALRTFYKYYLHFVQEEEKRCRKAETGKKNVKSSNPKKGDTLDVDTKKGARRPDLKALVKMRETNTILYPNKIGSIPAQLHLYPFTYFPALNITFRSVMEAPSYKKRVRHDSDESLVSLPDVKRPREDLLNIQEDDSDLPTTHDLDYFIKTFENEISAVDSGESQPELGFLLEASDDELGLPPPTSSLEKAETELVRVTSDSSELSELWGFKEEVSGYDSFDLGFGDAVCDYNNGGEFVTVDGLFDYSDMGFGSSDILLHPKILPAL